MILAVSTIVGCSSGNSPTVPPVNEIDMAESPAASGSSRSLLGFWEIAIDCDSLDYSVTPMRSGNIHLNALKLIEPPSGSTLGLSNLTIDGTVLGLDITFNHPFPGYPEFAIFDVRGIIFSSGSVTGFEDQDIVFAGANETHLKNADGLTRWWNPVEFPDIGTIFCYRDGRYGIPNSTAHYSATLNTYKVFADSLDSEDPVDKLVDPGLPPIQTRAITLAGQSNTRRFEIDCEDNGSGGPLIILNYGFDVSWEIPDVMPPEHFPDDFPVEANCQEPFLIEIAETSNTLYYDISAGNGGLLGLDIRIHDWQGAFGDEVNVPGEVDVVRIESLTCFENPATAVLVPGSGCNATFSTWHVDIEGSPHSADDQLLLVTVESSKGDWQPGFTGYSGTSPLSSYMTAWVSVDDEAPVITTLHLIAPNGGETWYDNHEYLIEWESSGDPIDNVKIEYSTDGFTGDINEIFASTPNDGSEFWTPSGIDSDSVRVRVSDVLHPGISDMSDDDFTITESGIESTLTLITPNGGEIWRAGCTYEIEWTSDGDPIDFVKLDYSSDGFSGDINPIVDSTPNDGSFEWEIPVIISDTLKVKVSAVSYPGVFDISDEDFSIIESGPAIWRTQKFDYQNRGVSPYNGPATNNVVWETNINGEMTPGPSIGDDGTIYVGTNDGRFVAVDPSGDIKWTLQLGSFVLGCASITDEGRIYVGSWGMPTGYLYAIECEGEIVWQFDCGGNINHATAAVGDDGTVYIGNNNGDFWAINPDGNEKWHFDIPGGGFMPSPALGSDGSIYVTSVNGHAYGLTDNGQGDFSIFWDHNFGAIHIGCPPSVHIDSPLVTNDVVYVSGLYEPYVIYACDPFTDIILWTGQMGKGTTESCATIGTDHTVYIGCNDSFCYAFNQDGSEKWSFETGQQITAAPIIDPGGRLYVPSRDHWIYCLDSVDGSEIWKFETGDIIRTEVAIGPDGTLYCGGHDGILRAFRDE